MLTDTHTHLYLPEFDADNLGVDAVNRAIEAGVERMIFPNVDLGTIEPMKRLHSLFPDNTRMAMGFHPTEVNDGWADSLDVVELLMTLEDETGKTIPDDEVAEIKTVGQIVEVLEKL